MPDRLSLHAPVLVNTIGHCAGAIAFGILLYLLILDWRRATGERSLLPSIAAGLAFLWNVGSLIGMATAPWRSRSRQIIAGSFSVLSLLPAVLLHISLRLPAALSVDQRICGQRRRRGAAYWRSGYRRSPVPLCGNPAGDNRLCRAHNVSVIQEAFSGPHDGGGKRLAGAMVLFLFAISFVHFESAHDIKAWSGEAALHHAGIPLALFVLLQDYRFLLLDAFIRFLVNGLLAAAAVWISFKADAKLGLVARASHDPFYAGLVFTGACFALSVFAYVRVRVQRFLTHAVFLRSSPEKAALRLREIATTIHFEPD